MNSMIETKVMQRKPSVAAMLEEEENEDLDAYQSRSAHNAGASGHRVSGGGGGGGAGGTHAGRAATSPHRRRPVRKGSREPAVDVDEEDINNDNDDVDRAPPPAALWAE